MASWQTVDPLRETSRPARIAQGSSVRDTSPAAGSLLYGCFDFRLRSEIPFPELSSAKPGEGAIVEISRGHAPLALPGAMPAAYGLQIAGDTALLSVPRTARYLIRDGHSMIVDELPGASERNVRLFALGSALAVLCYQREMLLLHANAIRVGGAAVAFAGPSGAGKSTLAAQLELRGHPVLCDDVCALTIGPSAQPLAWPGVPRLKLWADAAALLGHDAGALELAIEGQDKYHVPLAFSPSAPLPLRRLYLLDTNHEAKPGIEQLSGAHAMEGIMANSYRGAYLGPMGLEKRHFHQCLSLLGAVDVFAVSRRWGFDSFETQLDRLEAHMAGLGQ